MGEHAALHLESSSARPDHHRGQAGADDPSGGTIGPRYFTLGEALRDPDVMQEPVAVVPPLVYSSRVTLLAAREKMGKSTLAGQAAAALSIGSSFLAENQPLAAGRVLWYASDEALSDTASRLDRFGGDHDRIVITDARPSARDFERDVRRFEPALIVIDTLADFWSGRIQDENDAAHVNPLLRPYVTAVRNSQAGLLLIAHMNKRGDEYRGSQAIGAIVDGKVMLRPPERVPAYGRRGDGTGDRPEIEVDDPEADDGRRELRCRTRWGLYTLRLTWSGGRYSLSAPEPRLRERILDAIRDGRAASANEVVSVVHGRREEILREVRGLEAAGQLIRAGRRLVYSESSSAPVPSIGPGDQPRRQPGTAGQS